MTKMIGVGSYRLNKDRPNAFVATWYSTNLPEPQLGSIGIAMGDQLVISYWSVSDAAA